MRMAKILVGFARHLGGAGPVGGVSRQLPRRIRHHRLRSGAGGCDRRRGRSSSERSRAKRSVRSGFARATRRSVIATLALSACAPLLLSALRRCCRGAALHSRRLVLAAAGSVRAGRHRGGDPVPRLPLPPHARGPGLLAGGDSRGDSVRRRASPPLRDARSSVSRPRRSPSRCRCPFRWPGCSSAPATRSGRRRSCISSSRARSSWSRSRIAPWAAWRWPGSRWRRWRRERCSRSGRGLSGWSTYRARDSGWNGPPGCRLTQANTPWRQTGQAGLIAPLAEGLGRSTPLAVRNPNDYLPAHRTESRQAQVIACDTVGPCRGDKPWRQVLQPFPSPVFPFSKEIFRICPK